MLRHTLLKTARLATLPLAAVVGVSATPGCATRSDSAARQEVLRQAESHEPAREPDRSVMKPMMGRWLLDIEATVRANPHFDDEMRAKLRRDLEANPFELEITHREYVSRGPIKTNWDLYTPAGEQGDMVIIRLESPRLGASDRERRVKLRVRDGRLFINPMSEFTCVMTRAPAGAATGPAAWATH